MRAYLKDLLQMQSQNFHQCAQAAAGNNDLVTNYLENQGDKPK
jgi:hypothetical protein